jgi:hypothetical protein
MCWTALLFVSDVCAGQLLFVSEPNKQLSYLQKTTFLFGTRPKQSHPNKEKRGVAGGRGKRKE